MANDSTTTGYLVPTSTAPAGDAALDALLQTLMVGVTGLPGQLVRPRWQPTVPKTPEPEATWCAIGVVQIQPDDNPAIVHSATGTGSDTLYRHELIEVLASFYGPEGQQYAEMARDGLWLAQNNDTLAPALMVFTGEASAMRSVPELINQQWRRRYDFSAWFRRQIVRTYGVRHLVAAEADLYTDSGKVAEAIVPAQ